MTASISFVCEPGRLEAQAVLLAASLRAQHPDLELVAAIPRALPDATHRVLADLGVGFAPIANPVADDYPIGNKVAALGAGDPGDLRVFLDTDVLCLAPLDGSVLRTHPFAAKSADIATFGDIETWRRLYRRFDLELPPVRIVASVSEVLMPPYFNAGMLTTSAARRLAPEWARICREIDAMDDIHPRRPWLDQIALPIALARLGLGHRLLDESWNYPAHMKPVAPDAALVHYHQPEIVAREPVLAACVGELMKRNDALAAIVRADSAWAPVLAVLRLQGNPATRKSRGGFRRALSGAAARSGRWIPAFAGMTRKPTASRTTGRHAHDLIISGIPRSGTSYLTRLLDGFDNVAAINEPAILFEWLRYSPDPWIVPILHADLRRRIDTGDAVDNKLDAAGKVTEDTTVDQTLRAYRPQLRDADWVLATKNTLAYMARLEGIGRLLPAARVVLCVRHPLDALASWKASFAHLVSGDPTEVPVGGLADPFLPGQLRAGLETIASLPDPAYRRALWWRLLAEEVWRFRDRAVVVRYEDLAADPMRELNRVLGPLVRVAGRRPPAAPSRARTARRETLAAADYAAVATECADIAASFGYAIRESSGN